MSLRVRRLGIDTYQVPVVYMRKDSPVCRSEGFEALARLQVSGRDQEIIATLNVIEDGIVGDHELGLSEAAWNLLGASEGDSVEVSHPPPIESLSLVRGKVYGKRLHSGAMAQIVSDIVAGYYSDVHMACFVTACAGNRLDLKEMTSLTRAMIRSGEKITWAHSPIADKHGVGGLPGNRTTPLIVAIIAAAGFVMPKTSSRAITSPAGTADTMETLAPVNLDVPQIRKVVEKEGGCIVWGGHVRLSPADDILIRVEKSLDIDSEGQLVASILSKKAATGSTHVLIDMPVGPTAKIRTRAEAFSVARSLEEVGKEIGLTVKVVMTDGMQPVGRGIGPALEARDILSVFNNEASAPPDLKERAIFLAASLMGILCPKTPEECEAEARKILEDGRALKKFLAICEAQGGFRSPPLAGHTYEIVSPKTGLVVNMDNRRLAKIAKLAGAPRAAAAGIELHSALGALVERGQPLYTVHAETPGELEYALQYARQQQDVFLVEAT